MSRKIAPRRKNRQFFLGKQDRGDSLLFDTIPNFLVSIFTRRYTTADHHLWLQPDTPLTRSIRPVATWIGHATFLIQLGGINILTDPIFGDLTFLFRRTLPPGIPMELLPSIDVVLISHNHPDHMDSASLRALLRLNPMIKALVPQGDKEWFEAHGFIDPVEHTWWDQSKVTAPYGGDEVRCTFVPAAHWSQRRIFDKNRSLFGGWMVSFEGQDIYFAGDTAYAEHFVPIAAEFPTISTAVMPIGPREPDERMRRTHLCPRQAVQAFIELGAQRFVPMHWGTFSLGADEFDAPVKELQRCWQMQRDNVEGRQLYLPKAGQRLKLD